MIFISALKIEASLTLAFFIIFIALFVLPPFTFALTTSPKVPLPNNFDINHLQFYIYLIVIFINYLFVVEIIKILNIS